MSWLVGTLAVAVAVFFGVRMLGGRLTDTDYVYVEDNGEPRELTDDEAAYLSEDFHPMDSARPYIKSRYAERAPMGGLGGFLLRRQLPRRFKRPG